jgi:membrane-associated protease RseP (regulator of RpoE activity)
MIILSILIHPVGNYLPKWILPKNKQINPIMKLSGLFTDFFVAFFILSLIHLFSPKEYYINNKDAIYGLEFNKTMQQLGFKNGDKIVSVNNQPIEKISEITSLILLNSNSIIKIKRNNNFKELKITDEEIMKILHSEGTPISVKRNFSKERGKIQEIKHTQEKFSFLAVLKSYQNNIKGAYHFIIPKNYYKKVSGFNIKTNTFKEKISLLAFCSTLVGLLNLIPLLGFSLGNFIISLIEVKREKPFNQKKKNILCLSTVFVIIIFIFILHY